MTDNDTFAADSRAAAFEIISAIEANTGLAIRSLFEQDLKPSEVRERMHSLILNWVEEKQAGESAADADWPLAGQLIDPRGFIFGTGQVQSTPNVAVIEYNYNVIKTYRLDDVNSYVTRTANGLKLLREDMTPGEAAAAIIYSGLASFSIKMIAGTIKALREGLKLRAALTAGVKAMGKMSFVVGAALVIITELLLYLMFKNQKSFLGIVYNNSDLNLEVHNWRNGSSDKGDLYLETGEISQFMESHMTEFLDSPLVQVVAKFDVGDVKENLVAGGIFFAEKKTGLYGTEGVMVFTNDTDDHTATGPRFAALFACPYALPYINGVNVSIQSSEIPSSAKEFYTQLYDSRDQHTSTTGDGYRFAASCSGPTGGDAAAIYALDAK